MADDKVDIKIGTDNNLALTALEQVAASLQKMGEKGKEAGERQHDGSVFASAGVEELIGKMERMIAVTSLGEKAYEALASSIEAIRDRAQEAFDAQQKMAGVQAKFGDFLKPGESPKETEEEIAEVAKRTGAGHAAVAAALGQSLQHSAQMGRTISAHDALAEVEAAAGTTREAGLLGGRSMQIGDLRQRFSQFTPKGAATELGRRRFASQQTEAIEELTEAFHGADSYRYYSAFIDSLPEGLPTTVKTKIADVLIQQAKPFTHTESIADAKRFFATAQGAGVVSRLTGDMKNETGEFMAGARPTA